MSSFLCIKKGLGDKSFLCTNHLTVMGASFRYSIFYWYPGLKVALICAPNNFA